RGAGPGRLRLASGGDPLAGAGGAAALAALQSGAEPGGASLSRAAPHAVQPHLRHPRRAGGNHLRAAAPLLAAARPRAALHWLSRVARRGQLYVTDSVKEY